MSKSPSPSPLREKGRAGTNLLPKFFDRSIPFNLPKKGNDFSKKSKAFLFFGKGGFSESLLSTP